MSEPEEPTSPEPGESVEPPAGRSREQLLRDIRLALAIDGLGLDERRRRARGFDPYDSGMGGRSRESHDPWKSRRRG